MNPPHILIARNSRGPNSANPSASLSSPTETHAAAAGIFRSAGSPPWYLEECESDEMVSALSLDGDYEDPIEIDETFTENSRFPGTVKIIVESTTFCRQSQMESSPEMAFAPHDPDLDPEDLDIDAEPEPDPSPGDKAKAREDSLSKLESTGASSSATRPSEGDKGKEKAVGLKEKRRRQGKKPDAIIILKEEKASTFHDFLKFVYPHLVCTITWNNVEGLMNISHKLHVSSLERECLNFLLTHAAGRPIKAMRIAELFGEEELYRESSRFVLDNPGGWGEEELRTLSQETLLKLEKRRTWFLERVLKLGLVQVAKEYQCCATCPEPANCARLLEEKWRQAYQAVFRFGDRYGSLLHQWHMLTRVARRQALANHRWSSAICAHWKASALPCP
ncbi:hypothetical protein EVJ58_g3724 [Rhodofomes roseus]|uniref:BTB domain-containing protein n=1 Tax=Rhodofomes roseus TaxID=34475 RepID=A0A4Y9YM20_9APHY|nr:hypothetical protein EVJ58_g3724 [Rhodofomes roseus]